MATASLPVTEPTFGKLQKMKGSTSIKSKEHKGTSRPEKQVADLIGSDSVQDKDMTNKDKDKEHVEESETKTLLQIVRETIAPA